MEKGYEYRLQFPALWRDTVDAIVNKIIFDRSSPMEFENWNKQEKHKMNAGTCVK